MIIALSKNRFLVRVYIYFFFLYNIRKLCYGIIYSNILLDFKKTLTLNMFYVLYK